MNVVIRIDASCQTELWNVTKLTYKLSNRMDKKPTKRVFGVLNCADGSMDEKGSVTGYRTPIAIWEFKPKSNNDFANDDRELFKDTQKALSGFGQIGKYAHDVSTFSFRTHVYSVCIFATICRLIRWDWSGVTISSASDFKKDNTLARFLTRLSRVTPAHQGLDNTVEGVTDKVDGEQYREAKEKLDKWVDDMDNLDENLQSQEMCNDKVCYVVIKVPDDEDNSKILSVLARDTYKGVGNQFGVLEGPNIDQFPD